MAAGNYKEIIQMRDGYVKQIQRLLKKEEIKHETKHIKRRSALSDDDYNCRSGRQICQAGRKPETGGQIVDFFL